MLTLFKIKQFFQSLRIAQDIWAIHIGSELLSLANTAPVVDAYPFGI
jgi:hypothetical protein